MLTALGQNMQLHLMFNLGQRLRAITMGVVFAKILRRKASHLDSGEALNLVSNDSQRWLEAAPLLNQVTCFALFFCSMTKCELMIYMINVT